VDADVVTPTPLTTTVDLDLLPDGLVVIDETEKVELINAEAARLLGEPLDGLIGADYRKALPLFDSHGRDWWECTRPFTGLANRRGQPERQLTLVRPDGTRRELLATARYVRDDGRVVRLVVSLRDAAARERQDRSRAELVTTVAHELRSPLTSVKGFTATLLAKWARFTDEQKQLMLQTINADADRVTRLISELLDVSRIDAGRVEVRRQVVDVAAVAQHVVDGCVATGEPRSRFVLTIAAGLPEIWGDVDKVHQVIVNLVENALRHGAGTVTVDIRPTGDGVEVRVSDEGTGVPVDARPHIFGKFWRGSRRGGTGLGLYIARGLVEAHGGTIEAGSTPAGGAEFRFVLPAGTPDFAR
jgi:signal transduction histidine kinase